MPVTIVVGGQYGGEGKGKIVSYLALRDRPEIVAKGAGPNCRHRVCLSSGKTWDLRLLPASVEVGSGKMLFGPGSLIHIQTLFGEMDYFRCHSRVGIDYMTGVIEDEHIRQQVAMAHYTTLGTTYSGTGTASSERCLRRLRLAREYECLQPFLTDVPLIVYAAARESKCVLIEGGQSFWLSNYHGDYPYVTSRDTTAAAFASQVGIGPRLVTDVVLVVKCFPTRNSAGRLPREARSRGTHPGLAMSEGVEGLGPKEKVVQRRIGQFCLADAARAAMVNSASQIALTGVDVYDPACARLCGSDSGGLSRKVLALIHKIEDSVRVPVTLVSTGPRAEDTIDLRGRACLAGS